MTQNITPTRKKILVTGSSGFIGARLIKELAIDSSLSITALIRSTIKTPPHPLPSTQYITADLSDKAKIDSIVKDHDIVINLAHDFKRNQKNNLNCFSNLLEACIKHSVKHFVQVSSVAVYDDWPTGNISESSSYEKPGSEYKNTKVAIEKKLQSNKDTLHSTILQPTIVYGPASWLWTDYIIEKLLTGTVIIPDNGQGICNAVYVDDVVKALILATQTNGKSAEKYIISGPDTPTWHDYFESYNRALGTNAIKYTDSTSLKKESSGLTGNIKSMVANPLQIANWKPVRSTLNIAQQLLGEKNIEKLKLTIQKMKASKGPITYYPSASELDLYCTTGTCNIRKAKDILGYAPKTNFKTGFEKTMDYINKKRLEQSQP